MDMFNNVLEDIDKNYPFSLSPKVILALLILIGVCTIIMGILFIWYKRKTTFTSSRMGNIMKLLPSLNENVPTLNSLLPILSELKPSQNYQNALTSVAVPRLSSQTPPDELILPPVLVLKLQMESTKPLTTTPILYQPPKLKLLPTTSTSTTDYTSGPLSLEMFNRAATDLNEKGVINLRKYKKYLHRNQK